ncbi:hypothetical protein EYZ11_006804 [Aspergillus tanneri]|nr:hypothetical protein EYZ11_006804 [Aspergillus tanneri]
MAPKKSSRRKKPELLPSAIEELNNSDPNMKRAARSIEEDVSEALAKTKTQHKQTKRTNARVKKECPNLSMARYWAEKAESLNQPFEVVLPRNNPAPFKLGYDGLVRPASPKEVPKYEDVIDAPPLSNDAIAAILKQTKLECPKAQGWIHAHEVSKAAKEKMDAKMAERENLRKKVAHKLRDKAREAARQSGAPRHEIKAFLAKLPKEEGDGKGEEENSREAQMERVRLAHERLQKAIEEFHINK